MSTCVNNPRIDHGWYPKPCGLHKCDNPPCCNPVHLFEGTPKDNTRDMQVKGRAKLIRKEDYK
jgi:hypothetical protein